MRPMPLLPAVTKKSPYTAYKHRGFVSRIRTYEIKHDPGWGWSADTGMKAESPSDWVSERPRSPAATGSSPRPPPQASSHSASRAAFLTYIYELLNHRAFSGTGFWNFLWRAVSRGDKASIRGAERVTQIKPPALAWRRAGSSTAPRGFLCSSSSPGYAAPLALRAAANGNMQLESSICPCFGDLCKERREKTLFVG